MDSEVQTNEIVKNIFDSGKICFIPKCVYNIFPVFLNNFITLILLLRYNKLKMSMIKLESFEELKSLPKTKWNILQPSNDDVREDALDTGIILL